VILRHTVSACRSETGVVHQSLYCVTAVSACRSETGVEHQSLILRHTVSACRSETGVEHQSPHSLASALAISEHNISH
jgi:hypothetical protein